MAMHSFDIENAVDFFRVMNEAVDDYLAPNNLTSTRKARECAISSWHLSDWIYEDYLAIKRSFHGKEGLKDYQSHLKTKCKSLSYMLDITNGTKHCKPHKAEAKETGLHHGDFEQDDFEQDDFDTPRLEITLDDGTVVLFDDEIKKVRDFWRDYFINTLGEHV